jgi:hypothetical protein
VFQTALKERKMIFVGGNNEENFSSSDENGCRD